MLSYFMKRFVLPMQNGIDVHWFRGKKGRKTLKSIESIISQKKNIQEISCEYFLGTSSALSLKIENYLRGVTENEMVRWNHRRELSKPQESEGQESPLCCRPRCRKESDTTQQLNNSSNALSGQTPVKFPICT